RSEAPGGQRHGQPLVASDRRLREGAVLMPADELRPVFRRRPRVTSLRLHLCARVATSLVALVLSAPASAARGSPQQASAPPGLSQVARDVASSSARVRRGALRALRELGGPEALPLLSGFVGDPETDIREGALTAVIGIYVHSPANRAISGAAAAFEAARFH